MPSAVLFPHAALPLHIFEDRYRALVKDALAGDKVMALAQLRPGWEADYAGRPPMEPIACAGMIAWHEALEDGRYNLILQGIVRVRLLGELPAGQLYREVRAELLADPPYQGGEVELLQQALLDLSTRVPGVVGEKVLEMAARAHGGALADIVSATLVPDLERRCALLRQLDPQARLREVLGDVGELIVRLPGSKPPGPAN